MSDKMMEYQEAVFENIKELLRINFAYDAG